MYPPCLQANCNARTPEQCNGRWADLSWEPGSAVSAAYGDFPCSKESDNGVEYGNS